MRYSLPVLLLITSSLVQATTITSGAFELTYSEGTPGFGFPITLSGPDITLMLVPTVRAPFDFSGTFNFTRTFNMDFGLVTPSGGGAIVTYGGTTYNLNNFPSANGDLLTVNLAFSGPTVSTNYTVNNFNVGSGSASGVAFTMTGTATLVKNGVPIFTNLALSGSGLASYSVGNPPTQDGTANLRYAFSDPVPEPSTYAMGIAGLAALGLLRRRNQKR